MVSVRDCFQLTCPTVKTNGSTELSPPAWPGAPGHGRLDDRLANWTPVSSWPSSGPRHRSRAPARSVEEAAGFSCPVGVAGSTLLQDPQDLRVSAQQQPQCRDRVPTCRKTIWSPWRTHKFRSTTDSRYESMTLEAVPHRVPGWTLVKEQGKRATNGVTLGVGTRRLNKLAISEERNARASLMPEPWARPAC